MIKIFLVSTLLTILFSVTAYANGTYGVITGSRVNVREYAYAGTNNRLFHAYRGTVIQVHGFVGDFYQVSVNGTDYVYIAREFVRVTKTYGTVTAAPFARVYDLPGGNAFSFMSQGESVTVRYAYENFYGIEFNGEIAFVSQSDVSIPSFVTLPTARIGGALANEIIQTAKNYIGTRYLWGGTTPNGFDCSGFMVFLFTQYGISLNRSSRDQARNGIAVCRSEIIPGDLLFFGSGSHINHVGMYIGGDQFIHSSSHSTGGVRICSLNEAHNNRGFITARRVII
ncbi:MAG: C40 family peptidase [Defluviitaleaceae bacterium]|nr:C40 family peptidase [Defluviitaleaceae bacterium]MCL2263842.1 C40 family peptidase [Defluviitaleaceae bacterium]